MTGQPLSLVLLDIDFFKACNDRHGHPQGDACLRRVARVLDESASRTRDLRWPRWKSHGAAAGSWRRRRFRTAARRYPVWSPAAWAWAPSCRARTTARAFIESVDRRLYEAKRGGRDRIIGGPA